MSRVTLHCPSCDHPVAPRIETNVAPVLERYTCPNCKRTTLRDELVTRRELRIIGGGPRGRRGDPTETHFVLRPPGVTGDQNLGTYLESPHSSGVTTVTAGWSPQLGEQHDTPITSIDLYFTYFWDFDAQGPADPTIHLQFRQGDTGTVRDASSFVGLVGGANISVGPFTISTNQDGGPWTWAQLASLEFAVAADVNDQGSQNGTFCRLVEVRAEVQP